MSAIGGKLTFAELVRGMSFGRCCVLLAALLSASCNGRSMPADRSFQLTSLHQFPIDQNCPLSDEWELAINLKPSPVPYTPSVIMYGAETTVGTWSWHGSTLTEAQLLKYVVLARSMNPRPVSLFKFAEARNCAQLKSIRASIAAASKCSRAMPCIQGSIDEYRISRSEF